MENFRKIYCSRPDTYYLSIEIQEEHVPFIVEDILASNTRKDLKKLSIYSTYKSYAFYNTFNIGIGSENINKILDAVMQTDTITELDISKNSICDLAADKISELISKNTLIELDISNNNIKNKGMKKILEAVKNNTSLEIFNFSWNKFNYEIIPDICDVIRNNNTLHDFSFHQHNSDICRSKKFADELRCNVTLFSLSGIRYENSEVSDLLDWNSGLNYILSAIDFTKLNLPVEILCMIIAMVLEPREKSELLIYKRIEVLSSKQRIKRVKR